MGGVACSPCPSTAVCNTAAPNTALARAASSGFQDGYFSGLAKFVKLDSDALASSSSGSGGFSIDPTYGYISLVFLPFLASCSLCFCRSRDKTKPSLYDKLQAFDLFFQDKHAADLWEPVRLKRSPTGGLLSIGVLCALAGMVLMLIYQTMQFLALVNTRTSILPGSPSTSYGSYLFSANLLGLALGPDQCQTSPRPMQRGRGGSANTTCSEYISFSHNLVTGPAVPENLPTCSFDHVLSACNITWRCDRCVLPLANAQGLVTFALNVPYLLLVPQIINFYVRFPSLFDDLTLPKQAGRRYSHEVLLDQSWAQGSVELPMNMDKIVQGAQVSLLAVPTVARSLDTNLVVTSIDGQQEVAYFSSGAYSFSKSKFGEASIDQTPFTVSFVIARASGFFHVFDSWGNAFNTLTFLSNVSALFSMIVAMFAWVLGKAEGFFPHLIPRLDKHSKAQSETTLGPRNSVIFSHLGPPHKRHGFSTLNTPKMDSPARGRGLSDSDQYTLVESPPKGASSSAIRARARRSAAGARGGDSSPNFKSQTLEMHTGMMFGAPQLVSYVPMMAMSAPAAPVASASDPAGNGYHGPVVSLQAPYHPAPAGVPSAPLPAAPDASVAHSSVPSSSLSTNSASATASVIPAPAFSSKLNPKTASSVSTPLPPSAAPATATASGPAHTSLEPSATFAPASAPAPVSLPLPSFVSAPSSDEEELTNAVDLAAALASSDSALASSTPSLPAPTSSISVSKGPFAGAKNDNSRSPSRTVSRSASLSSAVSKLDKSPSKVPSSTFSGSSSLRMRK
eukprot:GILI01013788.1.p1 GENE.GILI01013788.1~~GILI01013788.1.p1  ORF type:complete len:906 (+),score=243.40 GILI01013788.1:340-2718(+)